MKKIREFLGHLTFRQVFAYLMLFHLTSLLILGGVCFLFTSPSFRRTVHDFVPDWLQLLFHCGLMLLFLVMFIFEILLLLAFFIILYLRLKQFFFAKSRFKIPQMSPKDLLLMVYLLTWVLGCPLVVRDHRSYVLQLYESSGTRIKSSHGPGQDYPYYSSFPVAVLPGVIVSYDTYVIGPLYGLGAYNVYGYYLFGLKQVVSMMIWIS